MWLDKDLRLMLHFAVLVMLLDRSPWALKEQLLTSLFVSMNTSRLGPSLMGVPRWQKQIVPPSYWTGL